MLATLG
jgi:bifunctional non-homologous end joining protein LigD